MLVIAAHPHLTRLCVDHQNVGSRPEQLLEVFVLADLLDERRHLRRLQQQRQQPHLDGRTKVARVTKVNAEDKMTDADSFILGLFQNSLFFRCINHSLRVKNFFVLAKFF